MNRLSPQDPIQLTQAHIESLFTPPTLKRARDYVMLGKVLSATANADFRHVEGQVSGSEAKPYRQDIRLVSMNHKLIMNGFCSCPATGHCKHMAAVLYSLLKDEKVENQRINQWLTLLDEADDDSLTSVDSLYDDSVLYILSRDDNGIFIELRRAKQGKKGGFNKGTKIALSDVQYYMPAWIGPEDVLIINLIMSTRRHGAARLYLKAQLGAVALEKMLATERCFWEDSRIALTQGQDLTPVFVWLDSDAEHKQLQLQLPDKENWELILTEPPAYVDLDYFHVGQLITQISSDKLTLLSQMPPVPLASIEHVSHRLLHHFPPKAVPTPVAIDFVALQTDVVIQIELFSTTLLDTELAQPFVNIRFMYGDVCLDNRYPQEPLSLIKQNGTRYQITRQLEQENNAIADITALGFVPTPTSWFSQVSGAIDHAGSHYWGLGLLPDAINAWLEFVEQGVKTLSAKGYRLVFNDSFNLHVVDAALDIKLDDNQDGWFSLSLNADVDGQSVPMLALIATWLRQHGEPDDDAQLLLPSPNGTWLKVNAKAIKPLVSLILELFDAHKGEGIRLPKYRAHLLNDLSESDIRILNGERIKSLAQQLVNFAGVEDVSPPSSLLAELRPYQQQGVNWLCFLKQYQLGGILADDMGLGKTIQTLAFLLKQHELNGKGAVLTPTLIICPTSLVGNWAKEAAKFAPSLKLLVVHGANRQPLLDSLQAYDVVVTTYPLIVRDAEVYLQHQFAHIVLDEAQQIKNAQAKVTQIIKKLASPFKLCLSGTPLENHLGELKSLLDFCLPGLLGSQAFFNKTFKYRIERYGDIEQAKLLSQRIAPFVLRRTKAAVISELPPKTEIIQSLELEKDQRNLYEGIRLAMEKKLRDLFATQGVASSHIAFLDALLKLRQACCDPRLVKLDAAQKIKHNAKLNWLTQHLPEMVQEGRKILIFSQFTSMLGLIETELTTLGIEYSKLTGQTRLRQVQIDKFQEGDTPVFLISLKAGGTGLNLTAADTVIHYDPWWNPAAEKQATDRAHRMGQNKAVFVYKLVAEGTVEEKIQHMQQHKQSLADSILEGKGRSAWQGDAQALLELFS